MERVGYTSFVLFSLYQIYLSVRIYWFTFCVIPTYSMSPTLLGGDYIWHLCKFRGVEL